jgi:hypothetical protein
MQKIDLPENIQSLIITLFYLGNTAQIISEELGVELHLVNKQIKKHFDCYNMNLLANNGAEFSECRKYRYALWRIWDSDKPLIMFVGLNPSTANEHKDDATIRRVKKFAHLWGYGGVYMMNCFPYVSTNPDHLYDFGNTAMNDHWLNKAAKVADEIIFAWGTFPIVKKLGRDKELTQMFPNAKALVINIDGSPRHPLYVPNSIKPVKWELNKNININNYAEI